MLPQQEHAAIKIKKKPIFSQIAPLKRWRMKVANVFEFNQNRPKMPNYNKWYGISYEGNIRHCNPPHIMSTNAPYTSVSLPNQRLALHDS